MHTIGGSTRAKLWLILATIEINNHAKLHFTSNNKLLTQTLPNHITHMVDRDWLPNFDWFYTQSLEGRPRAFVGGGFETESSKPMLKKFWRTSRSLVSRLVHVFRKVKSVGSNFKPCKKHSLGWELKAGWFYPIKHGPTLNPSSSKSDTCSFCHDSIYLG